MENTAPISTTDQADESPAGLAKLWGKELSASKEALKTWWDRSEKILKRYVDDRGDNRGDQTRLNLFTSNTQTMEALLFGKTPQVDVDRRFSDAQDDEARVGSEMLERILNTDIERDDDTQQEALRNALSDRLRVGLGVVWVRYEMGEPVMVPGTPAIPGEPDATQPPTEGAATATPPPLASAVPETETRPNEAVCVDYGYWRDFLWSPCRTFAEMRWAAKAAELTEDSFNKRFPKHEKDWTANRKNPTTSEDPTRVKDPLDRCIVWEIWSKEKRCVYWYMDGAAEILDHKEDPLGLEGFWPFPRPMFANLTTSKLLPTPDFVLAQDLYDEIDELDTRISLLEQAIRVVGLYDKNSEELKRVVGQTAPRGNEMIGVDSWAAFAEKGGIKGVTDWLPLDMIVEAIQILNERLTVRIGLLYQITGMSDIMRGQASEQTTATEQAIKARFASVRVQTLQDEFARFASDTQKIKAEIISKHFEPDTIIQRSNVMRTPDGQNLELVQAAVALIKQEDFQFRISVNPDSVSLQDFAALKQERFELASTIGPFFQQMMPMIQMCGMVPGGAQAAVEFTIGLAQTMTAGLKGSNEMEGIFDQFTANLKKAAAQAAANPPQPQQDPKLEAAKVKAEAEMGKAHAAMQQTQLDGQVHVQKAGMDMQVATAKHAMDMQKLHMGIQSEEAKARTAGIEGVNKVTEEGRV